MKTRNITGAALLSLLAAFANVSAQAVLDYNFTDSAVIPQGGAVFSVEHAISEAPSPIGAVELVLRFNDSSSLSGDSSGIQGRLVLGTAADSPCVGFSPIATFISGQDRIYDATFSGAPGNPGVGFNGLGGAGTWGLVLWDNSSSGFQNSLNSWSLNLTVQPVPEPMNQAVGVFAAVFVGIRVATSQSVRERLRRWRGGSVS
jgi:hypothetical protein